MYTFISSSSNVARAPRGSRTLPSQKVSTVSTQFDLSGGQKEYTLSEGWLDQLDSMSYNVVNVHGTPGQGLDESGFGEGLIAAGQLGEQRLAKLFVNEGVTASWDTYWSLRLPDSDWDTDVDCLLYRHGTIYLVDAKNYNVPEGCTLASDVHLNPVTSEQEYGIKVLDSDGTPTGKTYKMTKNMAMAIDKFKKAFPGTQILAAVVLTPISHTVPGITGKVVYPGDIPLFQSNTFIQMLQQTYGTQEAPIRTDKDRIVAQKLTELLKQKTLDSDSRIESIVSPQEKQANASQNSLETDNELGNM